MPTERNLSGSLPTSIGQLVRLTRLAIYRNGFGGAIPTQFCELTNLENLAIDRNAISGVLPTCIGRLTNVHVLFASNNRISGSIPSQLALLTRLDALSIENNAFSGTIPTQLASLPCVREFFVFGPNLTGTSAPVLRPMNSPCATQSPTPYPMQQLPKSSPSPTTRVVVQADPTDAPTRSPSTPTTTTTTTASLQVTSPSDFVSSSMLNSTNATTVAVLDTESLLPDWAIGVIAGVAALLLLSVVLIAFILYRRRHKAPEKSATPTALPVDSRDSQRPPSQYGHFPFDGSANSHAKSIYDVGDVISAREQVYSTGFDSTLSTSHNTQ
jgi:hypothetical protein